ncbi:MAG: T9SS type A sorting domain-containing protein [Bacteroidales bacterium]|nr:T9SS type A sorting domain-containing protein [Bacteroidales bacterium]
MKTFIFTLVFVLLYSNISNSQIFEEVTEVEIQEMSDGDVDWGDYNNDGLMDFVITGRKFVESVVHYYFIIYENNGNNHFVELDYSFVGIEDGSLDWGDYNNDNYLDMAISGFHLENDIFDVYSEVLKNNCDSAFSWIENENFIRTCTGEMKWGDYNTDGKSDLLQCGITKQGYVKANVYSNMNKDSFNLFLSISKGKDGNIDWGDYNNDGYLDFVITGWVLDSKETRVFKSQGDTVFIEQTQFNFSDVMYGSVEWGDYNNDGFLDILISGDDNDWLRITKIYQNIKGDDFVEINTDNIIQVTYGCVLWGDYNNDGLSDICVTGSNNIQFNTKLYSNNGNNNFVEENSVLDPVNNCGVVYGDYDNDNDLDVLITGTSTNGIKISKLYRNTTPIANIRPNVITNLQTEIVGNDVIFSWDEGTDDNQPSPGLNYNIYIYDEDNRDHIISGDTVYDNMYVASPQAFPYYHPLNGKRLMPKRGHIQGIRQYGRVSYIVKGVFENCKTYYWSVQAIDASFEGGQFAEEDIFVFDTVKPVVQCRLDTTIILQENEDFYIVQGNEFDMINFYDNCEVINFTNNYNNFQTLSGEHLDIGIHNIVWTVTDKAGNEKNCSFFVEIKSFSEINDLSEKRIKFYPNPTTNKLTIDFTSFSSQSQTIEIQIDDLFGKNVFSTTISTGNNYEIIDISSLISGIYFISFRQNQQFIQTNKLIVM